MTKVGVGKGVAEVRIEADLGVRATYFVRVHARQTTLWPEAGGLFLEHDNFVPANPLVTPEHIKPVWYFTPFYSVLRAVPDKFWGFVAFAASVAIPFLLPWLDRSPVKSIRYKGVISKAAIAIFVVTFVVLAWLGLQPSTPLYTLLAQIDPGAGGKLTASASVTGPAGSVDPDPSNNNAVDSDTPGVGEADLSLTKTVVVPASPSIKPILPPRPIAGS